MHLVQIVLLVSLSTIKIVYDLLLLVLLEVFLYDSEYIPDHSLDQGHEEKYREHVEEAEISGRESQVEFDSVVIHVIYPSALC